MGDGGIDICSRHKRMAFFSCPISCLTNEVADETEPERESIVAICEAEALPEDFRDGIRSEVWESFLTTEPRNETGILSVLSFTPYDFSIEICFHLEQLPKVFLVGLQEMVQHGWPNHDDFYIHGDRLWSQSCRGEPVEFTGILDLHLTGLDHPLERIPRKRLAQHVQCVHDQVAAVGLQHSSCTDFREVGVHDAHVGPPFNLADEIGIGRV